MVEFRQIFSVVCLKFPVFSLYYKIYEKYSLSAFLKELKESSHVSNYLEVADLFCFSVTSQEIPQCPVSLSFCFYLEIHALQRDYHE